MHGGFRQTQRRWIDGETYGSVAGGTDSMIWGGWNGTPSDTQTLRGPYVSPVEFLVPSHDGHFPIQTHPVEMVLWRPISRQTAQNPCRLWNLFGCPQSAHTDSLEMKSERARRSFCPLLDVSSSEKVPMLINPPKNPDK